MEESNIKSSPKFRWSVVSLICGILSIVFISAYFFPFIRNAQYLLPFFIFAIVFGIIALKRNENRFLSFIGIILGSLVIVFILFIYLATIFWGFGR